MVAVPSVAALAGCLLAAPAPAAVVTLTTAAQFSQGEFSSCEAGGVGPAGAVQLRHRAVFPGATCGPSAWCLLGLLPAQVEDQAAVIVAHRLYLIGGHELPGPLSTDAVRFADVANLALGSPAWTLAAAGYARQLPGGPTFAVRGARAVAVGGRIYVAGGLEGNPGVLTSRVWSSVVNTVTGDPGYWQPEPPLLTAVQGHALVQAAGALYVLGGVNASGSAVPGIQKAEILPGGSLGSWMPVAALPASACSPGGCLPCCASGSCPGWAWLDAAAAGRSLMFFGGNRTACGIPFPGDVDQDSRAVMLDDANVPPPAEWRTVAGLSTYKLWGYRAVAVDGLAVAVGGNNIGSASNAVSWTTAGLEFDPGTPDGTGLLPPVGGGTRQYATAAPQGFPHTVTGHQLLADGGVLYVPGGTIASGASNEIYAATLGVDPDFVNAASWLSAPIDLGTGSLLTRVAWTVGKAGGAHDDWAVVRYRVADDGGAWSVWSPRVPVEGDVPAAPGALVYASDGPVAMRIPLFPQRVRWVQVMADFYNDPAQPGEPELDDVTIAAVPAPPPRPLQHALELYPVPAGDFLVVRLAVVPEGAEVRVRLFNAAAHLAAEDAFQFQDGGIKEVSVPVSRLARGGYVVRVEGLARGGGPGLFDGPRRTGSLRGKALIRR